MSGPYSPERRRWSMDEIKHANAIRGPESPEKAAFYVEQGVLSPEQAAFWLENRRRTDAYLQRLRLLHQPYRPRKKPRMLGKSS